MAYQKKYYFTYVTLDGLTCTLEIWQDTADTITAAEVKAMTMPFSVELPAIDHKFQCVRGTGCEINLLSETDGQFFDNLYSANKKEFLIKHYIGVNLDWLGYLNTEMVREPYDVSFNYPFQVTGNDGFALMDRYQFLDAEGAKYTGIKSKYDIIGIIFDRIGLPFTELRIALATTSASVTITATDTLLHGSYVDCANFYDEDGVALTMREVLEGILKPYGAIILQVDGNIYITDIHSLASDSLTYKCFLCSDWTYSQTIVKEDNQKVISTVGFMGMGYEKERSGGKNKQVVSYSPYPQKSVIDETIKEISEFTGIPEAYSTKDGYNYKTLTGHAVIDEDSPATFETSYYGATMEPNIYLRWPRNETSVKIASLKVNPYLVISAAQTTGELRNKIYRGVSIKITGEILIKFKNNPYDDAESMSNELKGARQVRLFEFQTKIRVGSNYASSSRPTWRTDSSVVFYIQTSKSDNSPFPDEFTPIGLNGEGEIIPVSADISGGFYLDIYTYYRQDNGGGLFENATYVKEVWLRNLTVELVDIDTLAKIGDSDIEYPAYLDPQYKDEAEKVELICGSDATLADRAKVMYSDSGVYKPIPTWTRQTQTYKIEELLLNSLSSNYRSGYLSLNGMKLKNGFNQLNILTDTYTGTSKFMVKSLKKNYRDNTIECDLVEITPDELTIVK